MATLSPHCNVEYWNCALFGTMFANMHRLSGFAPALSIAALCTIKYTATAANYNVKSDEGAPKASFFFAAKRGRAHDVHR